MNRLLSVRVLALLCVALVSCATPSSSRPSGEAAPASGWQLEWARGAVFYEVFVRSFADSNGDGVGDFNGLTSKLDYLKRHGGDSVSTRCG